MAELDFIEMHISLIYTVKVRRQQFRLTLHLITPHSALVIYLSAD